MKYIVSKMSSNHNGKGLGSQFFYRETMRTKIASSIKYLLIVTYDSNARLD